MMQPATIAIRSRTRCEMIDVTERARTLVAKTALKSGLLCVYCPHTTCGVTIQENADPAVRTDLMGHLAKMVPADSGFRHAEGNSDAHIKSSLIGASATVIIAGGELLLGRWQGIFLCEFDGPRERTLNVQVLG